jgi:hypothetical protein
MYRIRIKTLSGKVGYKEVEGQRMTIPGFEDFRFFVAHLGPFHWSVTCADTGVAIAIGYNKRRAMVAAYQAMSRMGREWYIQQREQLL